MSDSTATSVRAAISARVARAALAVAAAHVAVSLIGSAFAPVLLVKYPLLLIAMSPDARHLALAVGSAPPAVLVTLAVLRRGIYSVAAFGIGAGYGPAAVSWIEGRSRRAGKLFRVIERLFARWGAPILVIWPFGSACILAGAARTRFAPFVLGMLAGHTLWVASTYLIGELISDLTARVLALFREHLVLSTLICVALVGVIELLRRRRALREREPP